MKVECNTIHCPQCGNHKKIMVETTHLPGYDPRLLFTECPLCHEWTYLLFNTRQYEKIKELAARCC